MAKCPVCSSPLLECYSDKTKWLECSDPTCIYKQYANSTTNPPPEKAATEVVARGVAQIPYSGLEAIGSIFIEGLKYGRDNWKKGVNNKEYQEQRCEHAIRHLTLWANGDRSENHLAKVAWFCVTQIELERLER